MSRCPPGVKCRGVIPALSHIMLQSDQLASEFNDILNAVEIFAPFQSLDPSVTFYAPLQFNVRDLRLANDDFERESTAYRIVSGQGLVLTPEGLPRFEQGAFLSEYSATNVMLWSQELTRPAWEQRDSIGVVLSPAVAPDGTFTAYRLSDPGPGSAAASIFQIVPKPNNSDEYIGSVYIRKTTATPAVLPCFDLTFGTARTFLVSFDPFTGATGFPIDNPYGAVAFDAIWVDDIGDWWRVSGKGADNSTNNQLWLRLFPAATTGLNSGWDVNASGQCDFWQCDVVQNYTPSSAISTLAASALRARDKLEYSPIDFFSATEGMVIFKLRSVFGVLASDARGNRLLTLDDAQAALIYHTGPNPLRFVLHGGTGATIVNILGDLEREKDYWVAARWTASIKQIGYLDPDSGVWQWGGEDLAGVFSTADNKLTICPHTGGSNDPTQISEITFYDDDKGRDWIEQAYP